MDTLNSCFLHGDHEGDDCPKCATSRPPQQAEVEFGVARGYEGDDVFPIPAAEQSAPKCPQCGESATLEPASHSDEDGYRLHCCVCDVYVSVDRRVGERRKGGRREFSDCCWAGTSKNRRSSRDRRTGKDRRGGR